jgi:dihydroceramide fatty acyl 2-hydroxylase
VPRYLRQHHLTHHYRMPESRFGVSSPLWDRVFGTLR